MEDGEGKGRTGVKTRPRRPEFGFPWEVEARSRWPGRPQAREGCEHRTVEVGHEYSCDAKCVSNKLQ